MLGQLFASFLGLTLHTNAGGNYGAKDSRLQKGGEWPLFEAFYERANVMSLITY
jgi:hypothetical protein